MFLIQGGFPHKANTYKYYTYVNTCVNIIINSGLRTMYNNYLIMYFY